VHDVGVRDLDFQHSLLGQSWAPRRQARGPVNAGGWDASFYEALEAQPDRCRSSRPLWSDRSFPLVVNLLLAGGQRRERAQ